MMLEIRNLSMKTKMSVKVEPSAFNSHPIYDAFDNDNIELPFQIMGNKFHFTNRTKLHFTWKILFSIYFPYPQIPITNHILSYVNNLQLQVECSETKSALFM